MEGQIFGYWTRKKRWDLLSPVSQFCIYSLVVGGRDVVLVTQSDDVHLPCRSVPEQKTVIIIIITISDNLWHCHRKWPRCSIANWFNTAAAISPISSSWKHLHCCSKIWCQLGLSLEKSPQEVICFVSSSNNSGLYGIIRRIRQSIGGYYGYGSWKRK